MLANITETSYFSFFDKHSFRSNKLKKKVI